jgi:hypothetical protein
MTTIALGIEHHFLNIPVAELEGVIEPNAIANEFAGKMMTGIHETRTELNQYDHSTLALT